MDPISSIKNYIVSGFKENNVPNFLNRIVTIIGNKGLIAVTVASVFGIALMMIKLNNRKSTPLKRDSNANKPFKIDNNSEALIKSDLVLRSLQKRIADGAALENPKLTIHEFNSTTLTLLNYTDKNIHFKGNLLYIDTYKISQFSADDCKIIAYSIEDSPHVVVFEQQDVDKEAISPTSLAIEEKVWIKEENGERRDLISGYKTGLLESHDNLSELIKPVYKKKKEQQKELCSLMINALTDEHSALKNYKVTPDIVAAITNRYEDILKKEFSSQYQ